MFNIYTKFKDYLRKLIPRPVFNALIGSYHLAEAIVANIIYGFPARRMKFVGITGTNGKTTTTLMVATILEAAGHKVGMSSSAFIMDGSSEMHLNDLPGRLTNANPFVLQKLLRQMRRNGVEWVSLECGSHALHQHRVWGIKFDAAIITNLTEDHLDYHGTMENYAAAKGILFKMSRNVGVINRDDAWADFFLAAGAPRNVTYGKNDMSDYQLRNIKLKQHATSAEIHVGGKILRLDLNLVGEFNAYNATAALAATTELGVDRKVALGALGGLHRVPGRFDAVKAGQKFAVLIDDSHTPDAIANVLKAAHAVTKGKLFIITGTAGERPPSRRAPMAKIASELADIFIATDDEPHHEDPDKILDELLAGVADGRAEVIRVKNRCDAMRRAFKMAKPGDSIVVAGMGYKHHRDGPNGQEPWDDYQVAEDILNGKVPEFEANWRQVMHSAWPAKR